MCVTISAIQVHYVKRTAVSNNQKKPYTVHLCYRCFKLQASASYRKY